MHLNLYISYLVVLFLISDKTFRVFVIIMFLLKVITFKIRNKLKIYYNICFFNFYLHLALFIIGTYKTFIPWQPNDKTISKLITNHYIFNLFL